MPNQPPQTPLPSPTAATMYCRDCGYALDGLPEPRCPECGQRFDHSDPRTFRIHVCSKVVAGALSLAGVALGVGAIASGLFGFICFAFSPTELFTEVLFTGIVCQLGCLVLGFSCLLSGSSRLRGQPWLYEHYRRVRYAVVLLFANVPLVVIIVIGGYFLYTHCSVELINQSDTPITGITIAAGRSGQTVWTGNLPPHSRVRKGFWVQPFHTWREVLTMGWERSSWSAGNDALLTVLQDGRAVVRTTVVPGSDPEGWDCSILFNPTGSITGRIERECWQSTPFYIRAPAIPTTVQPSTAGS